MFGLLVALLFLFRLWRRYVRVTQADEQKKAKELLSQQGGVMAEVVDESLKPVHTKLEEFTRLLEGTVRALAAGVVAPAGLPLAASLIGRDDALADLMAKLRAGTTSGVFAVEGMGGVGKSALAAEAVSHLAEDLQAFPGGAAWIACEGLEGEAGLADLWARVARALQLEQVAAQTDPQARRALLAAALAQGKRLLLALDNIEPGLDAETLLETLAVQDWKLGRLVETRAGFERALALALQLGDPAAERVEVHSLAVLDRQTERLTEARVGYERALALARQLGDPSAEQAEVHALAVLDGQTGRLVEARAGYERALALARQLGDPAAESMELRNLGVFIGQNGEPAQGRQMIAEALAISERLGDIYNIGKAHQFLAWLEQREGNAPAAIAHYREALRCFEQVQSPDAEEVRADLHKMEFELPFTPAVVRAVRVFLNTASWPETRVVLEQEQVLLMDEADQFLLALVEQAQQSADPDAQQQANLLAAHGLLLRKARESDIPTAWAWFEENVIAE